MTYREKNDRTPKTKLSVKSFFYTTVNLFNKYELKSEHFNSFIYE